MIELVGVTFAHARGSTVLEGADLVVAAAEIVIVVAQAGAGATTIAALLTGRLDASGRVAIAGHDLGRLRSSSKAALRRRIGIIPQELALIEDRTALANVALALEVTGVARGDCLARAAQALAAVEVPAEVVVAALPMALRQRVAWARAFVRTPDVLIADQPTSHQDADGAEWFASMAAELAAAGAACVVLAREPHLVAAAARRGWRALTLHQQQIVDPAAVGSDALDEDDYVEVEISEPVVAPAAAAASSAVEDDPAAITGAEPDVSGADPGHRLLPFPVPRSAGHRIG